MTILAFIFGVVVTLFALRVVTNGKDTQSKNKVHFYVARDKDGKIYLWAGKPLRNTDQWIGYDSCKFDATLRDFIWMNIPSTTLLNLKWEDEPVEVFLNMED